MTKRDIRNEYLHALSASVMSEFTRIMDSLSDSEWVRFASRVLNDQTDIRLAERGPRRTDWVMHLWAMRNGTVGELLDILQDQQLFRPRDIILDWRPTERLQPPPPPPPPMPSYRRSTPPPSPPAPDTTQPTRQISQPGGRSCHSGVSVRKSLPRPGPPPPHLESRPQVRTDAAATPAPPPNAMRWPFDEVRRGTADFAAARLIGEGGFGHVFRATMRNTDYAVKRLKEDSPMDWRAVKESFTTEVEKLSQYRHANIVELMGYSVSGGTHCLLYAFMPNRSLEDQLHNKTSAALSWSQRVSVLLGAARALCFLHACDPALIHGDIKSSNILLGEHLEARLGDFGLARFCRPPAARPGKTSTVVTNTVRGTLPYLPEEYVKGGELGVGVDIYSFGVVVLEVLTGRRALETDSQSKVVYLKDLSEVEDEDEGRSLATGTSSGHQETTSLPPAAPHIWRSHLDPRLLLSAGGACGPLASPEPPRPPGSLELAGLACRCLEKRKKRRPPMTEVFQKLEEVHTSLKTLSGAPSSLPLPRPPTPPPSAHTPFPRPPPSMDSSVGSLSQVMSRLGPLEVTYDGGHPAALTIIPAPPAPALIPSSSAPASLSTASSYLGPCESDESQGFSQYDIPSLQASGSRRTPPGCGASEAPGASLPASSLHSGSGSRLVEINPSKQRFLHKIELYHEGRMNTDELLSSHDLYADPPHRGPEESDELAYLPAEASGSPANTSA